MSTETKKLPAWIRRAMNPEKSASDVVLMTTLAEKRGEFMVAIIDSSFSEIAEAETCSQEKAAEVLKEFKSRLKDWGGAECGYVLRTFTFEGGAL